jgi:ATP adenylyltransferase
VKQLWAPWRSNYIKNNKNKIEGCIFCLKEKESDYRKELILKKGVNSFVIMNLYPYNPGHIMIAPYKHTGNLEDIDNESFLEMKKFIDLSIKALKNSMEPHGFNIGFNIGRAAGAGVEDHIHLHIVPRWNGDTNFVPVLSETRVISMDVFQIYDELYRYFNKPLDEEGK